MRPFILPREYGIEPVNSLKERSRSETRLVLELNHMNIEELSKLWSRKMLERDEEALMRERAESEGEGR